MRTLTMFGIFSAGSWTARWIREQFKMPYGFRCEECRLHNEHHLGTRS